MRFTGFVETIYFSNNINKQLARSNAVVFKYSKHTITELGSFPLKHLILH